ncbi:MAG: hypothetical protein GF329_09650 [Candidatus Lokiarchaeota archaeon]|nr:hypothetical protein [Candidatus Lokiarchaeota archaeon]
MKFSELNFKRKTLIQIIIATIISLLFQFVIPPIFRPFTNYMGVDFEGGIFGINNAIFTISIWTFSVSVSWFIFMDNPYINNLIVISLIPFAIIVAMEFTVIFLFWDYIHLLPLIVSIYIIWKKRDTLKKAYMGKYTLLIFVWLLIDYFTGLAYREIPLVIFLFCLPITALTVLRARSMFMWRKKGKKSILKKIGTRFILFFWFFGILIQGLFAYWYFRPNTNTINDTLGIETWFAVNDGWHNSNTDLILWNDTFYLVHDRRPFHFYIENLPSYLFIWSSKDAKNWNRVAEFSFFGKDIRDPKFALLNDTLYLYVLINDGLIAAPYQTRYTYTKDGINWNNIRDLDSVDTGYNFWRPKTFDNNTWYVPAYTHLGKGINLFNTSNGVNWSLVSEIYPEGSEPEIEFLSNGTMLCIIRHGGPNAIFGHSESKTIIARSNPPYETWQITEDYLTKFDGCVVFSYENKTFAVGRYQPEIFPPFTLQGSIFSKKRTAIFLIENKSLHLISELPSAGDTSYVGAVINGTDLYLSYYTSNLNRDYPWAMGWLDETAILMAKMNLTILMNQINTL